MRGVPFLYTGFVGGLNTIDSAYSLEDTESRDCLNVVATTRGAIRKRYGSTLFTASPPAVALTSLFPCVISGTRWLIAFGGTKVYKISTAGTVTDITGSASITSGTRWECVQAHVGTAETAGPVYMCNGVDAPLYWSGSGNVAAWTAQSGATYYQTSPYVPNGSYMTYAGGRIWMVGVAATSSTVFFSDTVSAGSAGAIPDPTSWPLENTIGLDVEDGYPITGIGQVGAYVIVFKEFKTYVITDPGNPSATVVRQLSHGIGCVAHRSIVPTVSGTMFLSSNEGIFITNGTTVSELSYKIRPTIFGINQSYRSQAAGAFFQNHYYLSFPSGTSTSNNRTLDYDLQLKAWFLHDLAPNQWCIFEPAGTPALYAANPATSAGVVLAFDPTTYQDSGSNYAGANNFSAYWFGAWQRFSYYVFRHRVPVPMVKKRVRMIYFSGSGVITPVLFKNFNLGEQTTPGVVQNQSMTAPTLPVNFAQAEQLYGNSDTSQLFGGSTYNNVQMIYGGQAVTQDARIYAAGVAEEWCVGFGDAGSNNPFEVDAYAYALQFRKS